MRTLRERLVRWFSYLKWVTRRKDRLRLLATPLLHLAVRTSQSVADIIGQLDNRAWVAGTIFVALVAPFLPWTIPNFLSMTSYSAVWVFAGFSGISAALLALLYAITTFRAQQLASRLPTELVGDLFEARWHRATLWRLGAVLLTSFLTLARIQMSDLLPSANNVVLINLILLFLIVLGIQRGTRLAFDRDYSLTVMRQLIRRVDDAYLNEQEGGFGLFPPSLVSGVTTERTDPFALVEIVCTRAMKDGDLTTARLVLRGIAGRVIDYLQDRPFRARGVLGWLGEVLSVNGRKALIIDEPTGELITFLFRDVALWALEKSVPWPERIEFLQAFTSLRHAAIREKKSEVATEGLHAMGSIFKKAIEHAPPEDQLDPIYLGEKAPPDSTKRNRDAQSEWEHIYDDWVGSLLRDMELIVEEDLEGAFSSGQFVHRQMALDVLNSSHLGKRQKRILLDRILWQSQYVVLQALKRGRGEGYVVWEFNWVLGEFDKQGFDGLAVSALHQWSEIMIEASKMGQLPWIILNQFAAVGRGMAREAEDERASIIAETLGAMARPLESHTDGEMRNRYLEAASALRSLGEWDKRDTSALKKVVQTEVTKYTQEKERLRDWRESIPARRRIPEGESHSTPWA